MEAKTAKIYDADKIADDVLGVLRELRDEHPHEYDRLLEVSGSTIPRLWDRLKTCSTKTT